MEGACVQILLVEDEKAHADLVQRLKASIPQERHPLVETGPIRWAESGR